MKHNALQEMKLSWKLNACITRHQSVVTDAETVSKTLEIHSILIILEAIITDTVLLMRSVTGDF